MAPWSSLWDRNAISWLIPAARAYIANDYLRGAITGVGFITAGAGLVELAGVFGLRRPGPEEAVLRHSADAKAEGQPHIPVE